MKLNKLLLLIIITLIFVIIIIFLVFYYKNQKRGDNTINKSEENLIEDILNIKSYEAKLDIKIETNKNKTKYLIKQRISDGKAYQEVLEPENIEGVITEYDGTDLKIINNKLGLEKNFQEYSYLIDNRLWLDSFLLEYKNGENTSIKKNQNEIVLKVYKNDNPYNVEKSLYIDKEKQKPAKLIIKDINKKILVYILYKEIEVL